MKNIVIKFIRIITDKCPNCGQKLSCIDYEGYGYALWYCPKCDGELEGDCVKDNKVISSNSINKGGNESGVNENQVSDCKGRPPPLHPPDASLGLEGPRLQDDFPQTGSVLITGRINSTVATQ